ncbi:MAG: response regulator [Chitinivorax sp.]
MPNRTTHRIYVVEDNQLLSEAYAFMLQAHDFVTECFITGGSFLASRWQPENAALLLDLCLPDMGGLEILAAVRMQAPTMPVIVVSSFGDVSTAVQAMKQGAVDFIEKPVDEAELIGTLRLALQQACDAGQASDEAALLATLTPRERQILDQLANGLSSKEIARQLGISPATVDVHRNRILGKLNLRTTPQAVSLLSRSR